MGQIPGLNMKTPAEKAAEGTRPTPEVGTTTTQEAADQNQALDDKTKNEGVQVAADAATLGLAPIPTTLDSKTNTIAVEGSVGDLGAGDTVELHGKLAQDAIDAQQAGIESINLVDDGKVLYSCHPMRELTMGEDYRFTNGRMELTPEQAEKFDELMKSQPPLVKQNVRKLDVGAVNDLIKARIESTMSTGIDTSDKGPGSPAPVQQA